MQRSLFAVPRKVFVCEVCGIQNEEKLGVCPACGAESSLLPEQIFVSPAGRRKTLIKALDVPARLAIKVSTGRQAWDTALGGGLVRNSSVLVYGPKGVGKSTSVLQIACSVAHRLGGKALFGSAEMPREHLRMYADRVVPAEQLSTLWIEDSGDTETVSQAVIELKPCIIVWDSIQRHRWEGQIGESEQTQSVARMLEVGHRVRAFNLLISQVTKEEDYIGESGLGHDCDVLVSLRQAGAGLVAVECLTKNRFHPTPLSATEKI